LNVPTQCLPCNRAAPARTPDAVEGCVCIHAAQGIPYHTVSVVDVDHARHTTRHAAADGRALGRFLYTSTTGTFFRSLLREMLEQHKRLSGGSHRHHHESIIAAIDTRVI
jgi:hypothetical protein